MKWSTLTPFAALGFVACGGLYVDLDVEGRNEVATGGSVSSGGQTGGSSSGAPSAGGKPAMDPAGTGGRPSELTRGGFGGAIMTFRDRDMGGRPGKEGCEDGELFFVYEPEECLAASACLDACDPESHTQQDISYKPEEGGPVVRSPSECRTIPATDNDHKGQSFAVFPCDAGGKCPPELVCVESELGRSCFVRDTPWEPGCTEAFCVQGEGPRPPKLEAELCGDDAPCCDGRKCSAEGVCELACASDGRLCDDAPPSGAGTCCDGLVCKGGYCAKP